MKAPEIQSVKQAILTFYNKTELRNGDIKELFGDVSPRRLYALKEKAKEVERAEGIEKWNACAVNTKAAYKAWGIDVTELERRLLRLRRLGLEEVG